MTCRDGTAVLDQNLDVSRIKSLVWAGLAGFVLVAKHRVAGTAAHKPVILRLTGKPREFTGGTIAWGLPHGVQVLHPADVLES
jgi:hypothetical protein